MATLTDMLIIFLRPFRIILDGVILLYLIKGQAMTTLSWNQAVALRILEF
jgi:hypothetical protein